MEGRSGLQDGHGIVYKTFRPVLERYEFFSADVRCDLKR